MSTQQSREASTSPPQPSKALHEKAAPDTAQDTNGVYTPHIPLVSELLNSICLPECILSHKCLAFFVLFSCFRICTAYATDGLILSVIHIHNSRPFSAGHPAAGAPFRCYHHHSREQAAHAQHGQCSPRRSAQVGSPCPETGGWLGQQLLDHQQSTPTVGTGGQQQPCSYC